MIKKYLYFILFALISFQGFSQVTWTFNNNSLNGWTEFRLNVSYNTNNVIFTTKGQNNPRLDHASTNVNADLYKFAIIKLRTAAGGPTLLRMNNIDGGNFSTTPITPGSSTFDTYIINMTDPSWAGTVNNLQLAFRTDDGSNGGTTYNSNGVTIEIEQI
ncbi:MAG TPA: hypothetical protein EYO76_02425 [Flavobacteriaceae bacterium]|nr:hypothetical protein [Flavobacteriaceae bacterium]